MHIHVHIHMFVYIYYTYIYILYILCIHIYIYIYYTCFCLKLFNTIFLGSKPHLLVLLSGSPRLCAWCAKRISSKPPAKRTSPAAEGWRSPLVSMRNKRYIYIIYIYIYIYHCHPLSTVNHFCLSSCIHDSYYVYGTLVCFGLYVSDLFSSTWILYSAWRTPMPSARPKINSGPCEGAVIR